jgi:hypothetical protein
MVLKYYVNKSEVTVYALTCITYVYMIIMLIHDFVIESKEMLT